MKKIYSMLKSMKFGIFLLLLIVLLSIIGTIIPQGYEEMYYVNHYNQFVAKIIMITGFHNFYNSIPFGLLFLALAVNLILCSISRLGNIINKLFIEPHINGMKHINTYELENTLLSENMIDDIFKTYGFKKYKIAEKKHNTYYAFKNVGGYFGSWLLHFGILLIIITYAYGHVTYFSESIYGVSGTIQTIAGTEYKAKLNDFDIKYRPDGSVSQYTSEVELLNENGQPLKTSKVSVNNPMRYKGYTFYQTGFGWAMKCQVKKDNTILLDDVIYEKTSLQVPKEEIAIYINRFYPDFIASSKGFGTASDQPKNPVSLYTVLYMGEIVKMDVKSFGETIKWNEYEFTLQQPMRYTYLEVNKMRGQAGAMMGAFLMTVGLVLVFYFKPKKLTVQRINEKFYVYGNVLMNKKNELKI